MCNTPLQGKRGIYHIFPNSMTVTHRYNIQQKIEYFLFFLYFISILNIITHYKYFNTIVCNDALQLLN